MSRVRDIMRQARGDVHQQMSVPALYLFASDTPVPCNVLLWLKPDGHLVGQLPRLPGPVLTAEPADHVRFDLAEVTPRRDGIVSVAVGEAYRIETVNPADDTYQTVRVVRLTPAQASGLQVPA